MKNEQGLRLGVGIVVINEKQEVFWAKRSDVANAWQFPQGGIQAKESPQEAMYRELYEEIGLQASQVELVAETKAWHTYWLSGSKRRVEGEIIQGQKQKWFLLRLIAEPSCIDLTKVSPHEFCEWKWVPYWDPLDQVVEFKRKVYWAVLSEFERFITCL